MENNFIKSVEAIEGHNVGMPVKLVFLPDIPGKNINDKKYYCIKNLDYIRKLLTYEPRSASDSYGVIVTSKSSDDGDVSAIYFDISGWHDMCGHATLFLGSYLVQKKLVNSSDNGITEVKIDAPAGRVVVNVNSLNGTVKNASLKNVPSFIYSVYSIPLNGKNIEVTVAFGGDFYAIIDLDDLNLKYSRGILPELHKIALQVMEKLYSKNIVHPLNSNINGLYGVRFQSIIDRDSMYGILFFGSRDRLILDRSPSGTGSSAHLAYLYFNKKLEVNREIKFLSSIDTVFRGKVLNEIKLNGHNAIMPEILTLDKGCYITKFSKYVIDKDDKINEGFEPPL